VQVRYNSSSIDIKGMQVREKRSEKEFSRLIENGIKDFVARDPGNRLPSFENEPIFDEPLVGFAVGDDSIFQDYKKIIGEFHLTPREALNKHLKIKGIKESPEHVSVISWILPISHDTRLTNRAETSLGSLRWNHTRWQGQGFAFSLANHIVLLLGEMGYHAVVMEMADFYERFEVNNGRVSNWSQRHIAYAAGLGTFSLNDGFITSKGIAMRVYSIITDAKLSPSPRTYKNHLSNCLFYNDWNCRRCIERCPVGAITEQGHDKIKCREFLTKTQWDIVKQEGRGGYIGDYVGCGLCQTKVPCESRIPSIPVK
jgi:ferredoxin